MYGTLLFFHFIGLALGLGTGFAMLTIGIVTKDMPPQEKGPFMLRISALSKNGTLGLALLILTGLGLLFMRGAGAVFSATGGYFHAKLALVVILCGIVGYMQVLMKKAKQPGNAALMARIPKISRFSLLTVIAIVALAVLAFH